MTEWRTCYELVWNNQDEIVVFQTKRHPYIRDGKPYGMVMEVAHNRTKDKWVEITPASGSQLRLITEAEAKDLMKDGGMVLWEKKP